MTSEETKDPVLYTNQYIVPPTFLSGTHTTPHDPFSPNSTGTVVRKTAQETLEDAGITFGPGAGVMKSAGTSTLIVKNTAEQMDLIEAYIESLKMGIESSIQCRIDIFEAPRSAVLKLIRKHEADGDQTAAFDEVVSWLSDEKAFHRAGVLTMARSGNRSKTASGVEVSFLSDYDLKEGVWNPNWEIRETGTIVEIDPVLGADNQTIDLNLSIEHHFRPPSFRKGRQTIDKSGEKGLEIDLPQFHYGTIHTQISISSGQSRILGTLEDAAGNRDHVNIVFLSARVTKLHLIEKTFDEKRDLPTNEK